MTLLAKFNLPPALAKWQVEFMRSYQLVAGDLVMSLMLDMAEHRGGLVRQGAVVEMLELVGISAGTLRSAISRLNSEGRLRSIATGRRADMLINTDFGLCGTDSIHRVYQLPQNGWTSQWVFAFLERGSLAGDRYFKLRDGLIYDGYFPLADNILTRPEQEPYTSCSIEALVADTSICQHVRFVVGSAVDEQQTPVLSWITGSEQFQALEARYSRYNQIFSRLEDEISFGIALQASHAFVLRLLMIHQYRLLVRDTPEFPTEMLNYFEPLQDARVITTRIYKMLLDRSEEYLSAVLETASGQKTRLDGGFYQRFGGLPFPE